MDTYSLGEKVVINKAKSYNPSYKNNTAYGRVKSIYTAKSLKPETNILICECRGKEIYISENNKHLRKPNLLEKILFVF
jgi:hypothetical protein